VVLRYLMTRTWMSMVCLLVAVPVATRDVFDLGGRIVGDTVIFHQGANIDLACRVVVYSAVATLLLAHNVNIRRLAADGGSVRNEKRRVLAVLFFLEAGALTVAIGLALADFATYVARIPDTGYREVSHVPGLIAVPSVALLFLLLRAYGAWNGIERRDPTQRRRSNWAVPLS